MNLNIANASKFVPFDASDYVWVDLSNIRERPKNVIEHGGVAPKEGALDTAKDTMRNFKSLQDFPLPFERIAIIPPKDNWSDKEVVTIDRTNTQIHFAPWVFGLNKCIYELEMHDTMVGDLFGMDVSAAFDSAHEKQILAKFDGDIDKFAEWFKGSLICLTTYLTMLAQGAYGEKQQEAHTCVADRQVNSKRRKKGKLPLYEWRTINMLDNKGGDGGSSRERGAVREHYVRGHYMHISKINRTVWRKSHKRGDASLGTVFHDYEVKVVEHV
jgi:hypothetical protein